VLAGWQYVPKSGSMSMIRSVPRKPPLVLVVDDDESTRLFARASLGSAGFEIEEARDGREALAAFRRRRPDAVLLDLVMPNMDGFAACVALRRMPGVEHIPILAITGLDDVESIGRAYETGATDFVTKPINWRILREKVRHALRVSRTAAALIESEEQLAEAQRMARLGNWEWEIPANRLRWSLETYRIFGLGAEEFDGRYEGFLQIVARSQRARVHRAIRQAIHDQKALHIDYPIMRPEGVRRIVHHQAEIVSNVLGVAQLLRGTVQDITERKRVEDALKESEERYSLAARGANDGLWDWDLSRDQIYYSPRWKEMLGYSEDAIGAQLDEWHARIHVDDIERVRSEIAAHLRSETPHLESEYRIRHRDGGYRWVLCRGLAVRGKDGKAYRMAGSQTDITQRKQAEQQLVHDTLHDSLTGLPNRNLFMDRLQRSIRYTRRRPDYLFAVLFMDLDRFKVINDSLGHTVGDQVLIAVGQQVKDALREDDTVARLGGDEFAILFDDIKDIRPLGLTVKRLQEQLSEPIQVGRHKIATSASMGIALSSTGYELAEDLLRDADTAMYRAKALGPGRYTIFDPGMHARALALWQMETDLRLGLQHSQFVLHYQPIIRLDSGALVGFEALLRWQHPDLGLLFPDAFLSVAEESGLIVPIGRWALRAACGQMVQWRQSYPHERLQFIGVNLSSKELANPTLLTDIGQILEETGLDPGCLRLEITENALLENVRTVADVLDQLEQRGIRLSIDNFGTGYSSLSYLQRFPFTTLKISGGLAGRTRPENNRSGLLGAVVTLAHNLGMSVVVQGDQTAKLLPQLEALRCEYIQGHFCSQPLLAEAAVRLLENNPYPYPEQEHP
jgi:diguanylate cyclase (GGDEF)-like protein/PAS domain S-box-containing protein